MLLNNSLNKYKPLLERPKSEIFSTFLLSIKMLRAAKSLKPTELQANLKLTELY